jgi:hypothetical protein
VHIESRSLFVRSFIHTSIERLFHGLERRQQLMAARWLSRSRDFVGFAGGALEAPSNE